jgi:hypothetical protein
MRILYVYLQKSKGHHPVKLEATLATLRFSIVPVSGQRMVSQLAGSIHCPLPEQVAWTTPWRKKR